LAVKNCLGSSVRVVAPSAVNTDAFLPRIKQSTNAVINLTTGGAPYMTVAERVKPAEQFQPEVASLNMGSMNFGLFPMLNRFKDFKHPWEREALEGSRDLVFRNSFADIEFVLRKLGDAGTRFEFECYDISHLYNLAHFLDRGLGKGALVVAVVVMSGFQKIKIW